MEFELITDGLAFPEGPIAMNDGSVVLVEIQGGRLTQVRPDGSKHVLAELGGGPNGAAVGPDGTIYICNNGGRFTWVEHDGQTLLGAESSPDWAGGSIQRYDLATGKVTCLYSEFNGRPLVAPNDIVFDAAGGFWFTDHGGPAGDVMDYGALYYGRCDGAPLLRARRRLLTPNGVGLSPDGRTLYFAESVTGRLWACDIAAPGKLAGSTGGPGRMVMVLGSFQHFDSLAVEADGKICVASVFPGAITIADPGGGFEQLSCPDPFTTNICFAGDDMRDAYITSSASGTLHRVRWPRPGLKLNFNA